MNNNKSKNKKPIPFEDFVYIINTLENYMNSSLKLHKVGISITNYSDGYNKIINILFDSIYDKNSVDLIYSYCHEYNFGKTDLPFILNNKLIYNYTIEMLYEDLKKVHN